MAFCDSLAHAAQINTRYKSLVETAGRGGFERDGERAFLRWYPNFADDDAYRMITEIIFSGYVTTVRWLEWVYQKDVKALTFRHKSPAYADKYTEILQCPITFEQPDNHLEFFAETVSPLARHEPQPI